MTLEPYPADRPRAATIRSRVMLEVASELVGTADWGPNQARITLRRQGATDWEATLFGSDSPAVIPEVASGSVAVAIVNPATALGPALRGVPPFPGPQEVRSIATIPSHDQLGVIVRPGGGIETLDDLATGHRPVRISLRGNRPDHAIHLVVDHLLAAIGTSRQALIAAGDTISYDDGIPHQGERAEHIATGVVDVVIDEGIYNWVDLAVDAGYRFLPVPEAVLGVLEGQGYRRSEITRERFPVLAGDVPTVDFSGFGIYTAAAAPADLVTAFCRALIARRDRIPWQGGPALPLERMVRDTVDAPLGAPLHPAAAAVWHDAGLL